MVAHYVGSFLVKVNYKLHDWGDKWVLLWTPTVCNDMSYSDRALRALCIQLLPYASTPSLPTQKVWERIFPIYSFGSGRTLAIFLDKLCGWGPGACWDASKLGYS